MCRYIDPASFMVYVFASLPSKTSMSLMELRRMRDHVIESLEQKNVVIDWTRDAVMGAMECYPNLFANQDKEVIWRGSKDRRSETQSFGVDFSDDFVSALNNAIIDSTTENMHAEYAG